MLPAMPYSLSTSPNLSTQTVKFDRSRKAIHDQPTASALPDSCGTTRSSAMSSNAGARVTHTTTYGATDWVPVRHELQRSLQPPSVLSRTIPSSGQSCTLCSDDLSLMSIGSKLTLRAGSRTWQTLLRSSIVPSCALEHPMTLRL